MKKLLSVSLLSFVLILSACGGEPKQLSTDELEGLSLEEQVAAIVENTEVIGEEFEAVIDENSLAVVYSAEYIYQIAD